MNKNGTLPLLDDFLLHLQADNFSDETVYNYERDLKTFEFFICNDIKRIFGDLKKADILRFKAYLGSVDRKTASVQNSRKKLGSYSINRILSALRSYLKFLDDMDYLSPLSPSSIKLVKTEKKHGQVPGFDELLQLIESPTKFETDLRISLRNRAMLEVLFATGMRISELLSLKLNQIDQQGRLYVQGKGRKQRFVYLTPRALRYLNDYLKRRDSASKVIFIPYRGRNSKQKDKKISANYVQYKIKCYRERLGINIPVSAHTIRHSFATYLAESGANPAAIQILLGHESLDTTTRYVHASDRYAESEHKKFHPLKD